MFAQVEKPMGRVRVERKKQGNRTKADENAFSRSRWLHLKTGARQTQTFVFHFGL